ncbi:nuclear transport factor 2 family protein [Zhongshania sp.]|uniref:nuclear transport factor 2 family protein n=1 Tax=Zhongshania sp. TaxID=1971902 RepID=UPI0035668D03
MSNNDIAGAEQAARLMQLLHRQDIHDCLLGFSRAMDRFDRDLFLASFHPDAIISAGEFVGGPVELYDWASAMHEVGQSATQHNLLNHTCDIDGDVAHTETYYLFVGRNRDDSNWIAGGRYIDRFERRNNEWKIAFRSNAIEWSGMAPTLPIPFADVVDLHLNGSPSRSKDDPSYLRPLLNQRELNVPK